MHSPSQIGLLTPLFTLPGSYGIGDILALKQLIQSLLPTRFRLLQFLPHNALNPSDPSPYSSLSAFAMNPWFIDLKALPWLSETPHEHPMEDRIDYLRVHQFYREKLQRAYVGFLESAMPHEELSFESFQRQQAHWLGPYCLFATLFEHFQCAFWDWPKEFQAPLPARENLPEELKAGLQFQAFLQWILYEQWQEVRVLCRKHDFQLMGDLPIYVSKNSADVWARPEMFQKGVRAGVPPDLYSEEGQDWGNPIYDWEWMHQHNYQWWAQRMHWLSHHFDSVRVDHIRGLHDYWAIEDGKKSKDTVDWCPGPRTPVIDVLKSSGVEIVGEDLGFIPNHVTDWLNACQIPGYRVAIFGWGYYASSDEYGGAKRYRNPYQWPQNSYATTSTHDSESLMEFLETLEPEERSRLARHFNSPSTFAFELAESILKTILNCPSRFKVFPIQDVLLKPLRINTPGTVNEYNWTARISLGQKDFQRLKEFADSTQ